MKKLILLIAIIFPTWLFGQSNSKSNSLFVETNLTRFSSVSTLIQKQLENYNEIPSEWESYIPDDRNYKFTVINGSDTTSSAAKYVNYSRFVDFRGWTLGLSREIYSKNKWQSNMAGGLSFSQANYMYHIPLLRNNVATFIGKTTNDIPYFENNTYEVQAFKEIKRLGLVIENELDYSVFDCLSVSFNIRQNLWLKYTDDLGYKSQNFSNISDYEHGDISSYYEQTANGDYSKTYARNKIYKPKPTEEGYQVLARQPTFQYDLQPMLRLSVYTKQKIGMYAQIGFPIIVAYGKDFELYRGNRTMNLRSIPKQLGFGLTYGF
jgi:hypothetical protein